MRHQPYVDQPAPDPTGDPLLERVRHLKTLLLTAVGQAAAEARPVPDAVHGVFAVLADWERDLARSRANAEAAHKSAIDAQAAAAAAAAAGGGTAPYRKC